MNSIDILIVEDEIKINSLLSEYFQAALFNTFSLTRGDMVLPFIKTQPVDLILLDIMLPGMDGKTVCRKIREISDVPIIMLTARIEEADILDGLELGADDYISKPFSPREVVARAKTILKRVQPPSDLLTIGPLSLNLSAHELRINNQALTITPNEFGILKVMMAQPNRVFSRNELVGFVQGYDYEGYDRTIDTHIKNLRKKIAPHLPGKKVLIAVYGVGYKFNLL